MGKHPNYSPFLSGVIVSGTAEAISASSRQYDNLNRLQNLQARLPLQTRPLAPSWPPDNNLDIRLIP